jgi:hypothetical protein
MSDSELEKEFDIPSYIRKVDNFKGKGYPLWEIYHDNGEIYRYRTEAQAKHFLYDILRSSDGNVKKFSSSSPAPQTGSSGSSSSSSSSSSGSSSSSSGSSSKEPGIYQNGGRWYVKGLPGGKPKKSQAIEYFNTNKSKISKSYLDRYDYS